MPQPFENSVDIWNWAKGQSGGRVAVLRPRTAEHPPFFGVSERTAIIGRVIGRASKFSEILK